MATCAILGSAFSTPVLGGKELVPQTVATRFGSVTIYRYGQAAEAFVLFRHGVPHKYLPHQIPYLAHAEALRLVGCKALLITSSVGVMDPSVPLFTPLLAGDLLMIDNRLPDGSTCTMFREPSAEQGHLVLGDGIFSSPLADEVERLHGQAIPRVVFAYVGGPRTKTTAENRALARLGAQVNSMTVGPEAVLAAELGIPVASLLIGHKHSGGHHGDLPRAERGDEIASSLQASRAATEALTIAFLTSVVPPKAENRLFVFGAAGER